MSELFESLQFAQLQPPSSPSTNSIHGSSSRSKPSDDREVPTTTSSIRKARNCGTLNNDRNRAALDHPDPRTPLAKSEKKSSTSRRTSSSHHKDSSSSSALKTAPLFPSTPSTSIIRPGHVYWHETPSPSQQIRQKEIRSYLASTTSPLLPLGTQAFREELLQQRYGTSSSGSAAARDSRQKLELGLNKASVASERSESSSAGASTSSLSSNNRRYTRRHSKRFGASMEDASKTDKAQSAGEGMQQLLADLDKHLKNQGDNEAGDGDEQEEESLIEELDRVFSSQKEPTTPVDEWNEESCDGGERLDKDRSNLPPHQHHLVASPSTGREWSRTKSLPAVQRNVCEISKRPVLVDVAIGQPSPLTTKPSVEKVGGGNNVHLRNKTRSSVSPPKKWATTRTPRIGLSRHSTGPSSQVLSHLQNGPAAPFKRPTKTGAAACVNIAQRSAGTTKEREQDIIIINDSDEDEGRELAVDYPVRRRSSPRKQAAVVVGEKPVQKLVRPVSAPIKVKTSPVMMSDEDSCFDTSMDESMLCEAVERAEASQEAFVNSQKANSAAPSRQSYSSHANGDDVYEMASSDNEALVGAMEAGGW